MEPLTLIEVNMTL